MFQNSLVELRRETETKLLQMTVDPDSSFAPTELESLARGAALLRDAPQHERGDTGL